MLCQSCLCAISAACSVLTVLILTACVRVYRLVKVLGQLGDLARGLLADLLAEVRRREESGHERREG